MQTPLQTPKFTYPVLTRIDSETEGRRYVTPENWSVPSVTTILSASVDPEKEKALANWRARVGTAKASHITALAAGRGTRMHAFLEKYVLTGDTGPSGTHPVGIEAFKMAHKIIENGLKGCEEYWGIEANLYYSNVYAGTTDLVGVYQGEPAIIDFKQTNKPKKESMVIDYYYQLAAYACAHNEMFGTNIRRGVVMMCSGDLEYQQFDLYGSRFDEYERLWMKRVGDYYSSLLP